jgi:hypothetical protein
MISKTYSVFCDKCPQWISQEDTAAKARREARANKWRCKRGEDICPRCVAQGIQTP